MEPCGHVGGALDRDLNQDVAPDQLRVRGHRPRPVDLFAVHLTRTEVRQYELGSGLRDAIATRSSLPTVVPYKRPSLAWLLRVRTVCGIFRELTALCILKLAFTAVERAG